MEPLPSFAFKLNLRHYIERAAFTQQVTVEREQREKFAEVRWCRLNP